jgi:hypothetical protein
MKKFLPFILLLAGIVVLVLVYFLFIRKPASEKSEIVDESVPEVALSDRPVTSLTPSADGHWLKLKIDRIRIAAASLDYELLYQLPDGRTQGVPGTITLKGQTKIERDLLLGSESSGKFRYDEGVEEGTLTLRFRNDAGKLAAKLATKFHLQSNTQELSSIDGKFKVSLAKLPKKTFFVIMETFGLPASVSITNGPYGVFSSTSEKLTGTIELSGGKVQRWTGSAWVPETGSTSVIGIFVTTAE